MAALRSLLFAAVGLFAIGGSGRAETAPQRLMVVVAQETEPYVTIRATTLKELARLGHPQGEHLTLLLSSLGDHAAAAPNLFMADGGGVDLVFVLGTVAAQAFVPVARSAPEARFVFASVTDPAGIGLIEGFGTPPKANITGVAAVVPVKQRLQFVRRVLPSVRTIGLIYGDMPQSISYRHWIEELLASDPEFHDLKVLFRKVDFIPGDNGTARMAQLAVLDAQELDGQVDAFLAPCDQMGVNPAFANGLTAVITKPLIGLLRPEVAEHWGAAMAIYTSSPGVGRQAAQIIARLLEGAPISAVPAEPAKEIGVAFDWDQIKRFGIQVPQDLVDQARESPED